MQLFDGYFKDKMKDAGFKALYDQECNVCRNTVGIFEKAAGEGVSMTALAAEVDSSPEALEALRDADCCDPRLVIRLCRRFGLPVPESCPKLEPSA